MLRFPVGSEVAQAAQAGFEKGLTGYPEGRFQNGC
jgi:hypothetical protein